MKRNPALTQLRSGLSVAPCAHPLESQLLAARRRGLPRRFVVGSAVSSRIFERRQLHVDSWKHDTLEELGAQAAAAHFRARFS
jgi:hypothetical protein